MYSKNFNKKINKLGLAVLSSAMFMSLFQVSSILATAPKPEDLENNNNFNNLEYQDNQSEELNDEYVEYYIYDGLKYELDQDTQTAKVIECIDKKAKCVEIPESFRKDYEMYTAFFTITEIKDNAFVGCKKLNRVIIGEDIKVIGKNIFDEEAKFACLDIKHGPGSEIKLKDDTFVGYDDPSLEINLEYREDIDFYGLKFKDCTFVGKDSRGSKVDLRGRRYIKFFGRESKDKGCLENDLGLRFYKKDDELYARVYQRFIEMSGNGRDYSYNEPKFKYELDQDTQTAKIVECLDKDREIIFVKREIDFSGKRYKLKSIGEEAFCGCEKLKEISLPVDLEAIGDAAFLGCKELKKVKMFDGVKKIGNFAFGDVGENCKIEFGMCYTACNTSRAIDIDTRYVNGVVIKLGENAIGKAKIGFCKNGFVVEIKEIKKGEKDKEIRIYKNPTPSWEDDTLEFNFSREVERIVEKLN